MPPPSGRKPASPSGVKKPREPAPEEATRLFDTRKPPPGKGRPAGAGGGGGPERTVLFDSRKLQAPAPRAKLVGLSGKRRGQTFPLAGTELTIGREPSNDIVIADISVSRTHARLRKGPEGWLISDAGGGNGTRVNGLAVDEVLLHEGDQVELGSTLLEFQEPPPEPKAPEEEEAEGPPGAKGPAKGRPAGKKPMPLVRKVAIGVGVVMLLAILLKLALPRAGGRGPALLQTGDNVDQFAIAKKLILESKWAEAKKALYKAQESDPDSPELKHYLDTVSAEIVSQEHLDSATAAYGKQDYVGALTELKRVGSGSLLSDKADALKAKIDVAVAGEVHKASEALAREDVPEAKRLLDLAMAAEPDQPQALALLPKLNGALVVARVNEAERERLQKIRDAEMRLETGPVGQARGLFRTGNVIGALAMLKTATGSDAVAAVPLSANISGFARANQAAKAALSSRRNDAAVKQLGEAHRLALEVGGSDARPTLETGRTLAQLHDQLGITARSGRQMEKAYRHFAAAHEADPSDVTANEQLKKLQGEAKVLYEIGYGQLETDPDAAMKTLKLVVEMTAPGSEYNLKAQSRLKQLAGGGGPSQ